MKKFALFCLVLGGLSLVGSLSAGHNPTGPLFWLILGIVLICIANNKKEEKEETTSISRNDNVAEKPPTPKTVENVRASATKPQKPLSLWEKYQIDYPGKAKEIKSLGIDFSKEKDSDVKEKIFSLETTANDSKCSISSLKSEVFSHYEKKNLQEYEYILLLESWDEQSYEEAKKYNIDRNNTFHQFVIAWLLEKVNEIERRYSQEPPRVQKNIKEAILQFNIEDDNEWSVFRKTHLYYKNYPMHPNDKKYIGTLTNALESFIEDSLRSFLNSEDCKSNPQLFNALLPTQIYMKTEEIRNDNGLINECNEHDVSLYLELERIEQNIINRYRLPEQ